MEVLKYLHSEGCPWNKWTCAKAAQAGRLDILKWLRTEGCECDITTCSYAVQKGHTKVLKYLWNDESYREKYDFVTDHDFYSTCMFQAAVLGHISILKWYKKQGNGFDISVASAAAQGGHLNILKWLRLECGCDWDKTDIMIHGRYNNDYELLHWVNAQSDSDTDAD